MSTLECWPPRRGGPRARCDRQCDGVNHGEDYAGAQQSLSPRAGRPPTTILAMVKRVLELRGRRRSVFRLCRDYFGYYLRVIRGTQTRVPQKDMPLDLKVADAASCLVIAFSALNWLFDSAALEAVHIVTFLCFLLAASVAVLRSTRDVARFTPEWGAWVDQRS